jgi:hypothetical protein
MLSAVSLSAPCRDPQERARLHFMALAYVLLEHRTRPASGIRPHCLWGPCKGCVACQMSARCQMSDVCHGPGKGPGAAPENPTKPRAPFAGQGTRQPQDHPLLQPSRLLYRRRTKWCRCGQGKPAVGCLSLYRGASRQRMLQHGARKIGTCSSLGSPTAWQRAPSNTPISSTEPAAECSPAAGHSTGVWHSMCHMRLAPAGGPWQLGSGPAAQQQSISSTAQKLWHGGCSCCALSGSGAPGYMAAHRGC